MRPVPIALSVFALLLAAAAADSFGPPDRSRESSAGGNLQAVTATEAPTGFDGQSNGFAEEFCRDQDRLASSPNSPKIPADECNFEAAEEEFIGPETVADGLGPIFNAAGCGECHTANPAFDPDDFTRKIFGATSEITEKRAGFWDGRSFRDHPGGSLIHNRSLRTYEQERVLPGHNVLAVRSTLSVLGDGFVEAISNETLRDIADRQPFSQRGQLINVPVLEKPGTTRVGRFGHKDQQASLVSFSADAYVNEMGITSPLQPDEPTFNGVPVDDPVDGVDDEGVDVELFALFMRSTKAPPVDEALAATEDARRGRQIFNNIGCAVCHTPTIVTAAPGTSINGGALKVTQALGNKTIHPFSDFLLHDLGTGDGIVQNRGRIDAEQDADCCPLGCAAPRPLDARPAQFQFRGRDQAPRQPGRERAGGFQPSQLLRQEEASGVPIVALVRLLEQNPQPVRGSVRFRAKRGATCRGGGAPRH